MTRMIRNPRKRIFQFAAVCVTITIVGAAAADQDSTRPGWLRGASWYYIDVAHFRATPTGTELSATQRRDDAPNGTLEGVTSQLDYLSRLGVQVICLSPILSPDGAHVVAGFSVAQAPKSSGSTDGNGRAELVYGPDRALRQLLREAHRRKMRVVLEVAEESSWETLRQTIALWSRPTGAESKNMDSVLIPLLGKEGPGEVLSRSDAPPQSPLGKGGGTSADISRTGAGDGVRNGTRNGTGGGTDNGDGGVDGWLLPDSKSTDAAELERLRDALRRVNPDAILAARSAAVEPAKLAGVLDAVVSAAPGERVRQLATAPVVAGVLRNLAAGRKTLLYGDTASTHPLVVGEISTAESGRLLYEMLAALQLRPTESESTPRGPEITDAVLDRWRLVMALHYLHSDTPMTIYGDEVGVGAGDRRLLQGMEWQDITPANENLAPADKARSSFRPKMFQFIRLLHELRDRFDPLRTGCGKLISVDGSDSGSILAFQRSLMSEQVIVVLNFGDQPQRVKIPVGWPRQLVLLVSPQVRPSVSPNERLRIGASRQQADQWADVSMWIKPLSFRLVVVSDTEPR